MPVAIDRMIRTLVPLSMDQVLLASATGTADCCNWTSLASRTCARRNLSIAAICNLVLTRRPVHPPKYLFRWHALRTGLGAAVGRKDSHQSEAQKHQGVVGVCNRADQLAVRHESVSRDRSTIGVTTGAIIPKANQIEGKRKIQSVSEKKLTGGSRCGSRIEGGDVIC